MPHVRRKRTLLRLSVFGLLVGIFFSSPPTASATSSLVIGEVAWAGSSRSIADEWLELWNLGDQPLALDGFRLVGAGSTDIVFGPADAIAPRAAFLVANYGADDPKSILANAPNLVTTAVSLPNDALNIKLLDGQGATVDEVGDGGKPYAGTSLLVKISMLRQDPARADSTAWTAATSNTGLDSGVTDLGTPGVCDACTVLPVTVTTSTTDEIPTATSTPDQVSTSTSPTFEISSEPTVEDLTATSTTTTVGELIVEDTAASSTATSTGTETVTTTAVATSTPPIILLREINAYPESGAETVDLLILHASDTAPLEGWSLHDGQGQIFKFTSSSQLQIQTNDVGLNVRATLTGSHLNNDGDSVSLHDAQSGVWDGTTYPSLQKGQLWSRGVLSEESWHLVGGVTVSATASPTVSVSSVSAANNLLPASTPTVVNATASTTQPLAVKKPATVAATKSKSISIIYSDPPASAVTSSVKKITTVKTTAAKPKTKTVKTASASKPVPAKRINNYQQLYELMTPTDNAAPSSIRVQIQGTVGTVPKLLATNQFVILNSDGRGLFVRGNSKQPSPPIGLHIELTGSLVMNDQGLRLEMTTKDRWRLAGSTEDIAPRVVDLLAPDQEDAWSLVDVTGTVQSIKTSYVTLDADGVSVNIQIRPIINYRTARLKVGDVIKIRGLVDLRGQDPKIYPRQAEDITLINHAADLTAAANTSKSSLPPWSPFAAAGITLAIGQGFKRLQKIRERHKLERMLEQASLSLTEST